MMSTPRLLRNVIPWAKMIFLSALILQFVTSQALGQFGFINKVINKAGDVAKLGVNVVVAPAKTLIATADVARGKGSLTDVYKPYQDIAKKTGETTSDLANLAMIPERTIFNKAQEFSSQFGSAGNFVFDVGTFQNRFFTELGNASLQSAANILKGKNPLQTLAAPLAAAIRAAREKHVNNSQPLPKDMVNALSSHFSPSILGRARYSVGSIDITLPNLIGQSRRFMGDHYAVVVDDIIVFNSTPPAYSSNPFWWIHELTHVQQFSEMGVEKFAYEYLKDFGSAIETEADDKARQLTHQEVSTANVYKQQFKQPLERIIAECVFPKDDLQANYLISSSGKIYAVDPLTGRCVHIGYTQPPLAPGIAWTYKTANLTYAVTSSGAILTIIDDKWEKIGTVYKI